MDKVYVLCFLEDDQYGHPEHVEYSKEDALAKAYEMLSWGTVVIHVLEQNTWVGMVVVAPAEFDWQTEPTIRVFPDPDFAVEDTSWWEV